MSAADVTPIAPRSVEDLLLEALAERVAARVAEMLGERDQPQFGEVASV